MRTKIGFWWKAASILAIAAALLLAPALLAQRGSADDGAAGTVAAKPADSAQPGDSAAAPAPANPGSDPHIKPGSDFPRIETSPAFMYIRIVPGMGSEDFNCFGGGGTLAYNFTSLFGIAADLGGCKITGLPNGISGNLFTYLFGPRLTFRGSSKIQPFVEVNFGGTRIGLSASLNGASGSASRNAFAMTAGGGLDYNINKKFGIRLAQLEYLYTRFGNDVFNNVSQNNFRLKSGVVFRFGAKPIMVNRPPTAACSADASSVVQGSGGSIPVRANASDPDGDSLTYSWSASGGSVDGSGPTARWTPGNASPGSYTVTARVDDGHGGSASCSANVSVEARPLRPPTMSCSVDRNSVMPGEVVNVTGNASSPEGFPLDYTWRSSGGRVSGTGSRVQFDTSGLGPGDYNITGRVTDGHNGAADCVASVRVNAPPAKPQVRKLGECIFKPGNTRVDNKCSRLLDDAVLRLQNDPNGTIVLIGYEDPVKETKGKVADTRAENAKKYTAKGNNSGLTGRVNTRKGAGVEGADTANRRVEIFWVPEGAVF